MSKMTHGGGVVVRTETNGELRVLLVRSKDGAHWVLPKGRIEPGETARQAAIREVREESGVVGEVVGELGVDSYTVKTPKRGLRPVASEEASGKKDGNGGKNKKQGKKDKKKKDGNDGTEAPDSQTVHCLFFLMRYGGVLPADEDRVQCWLPLDAASATIEFEGSKALIDHAARLLSPEM